MFGFIPTSMLVCVCGSATNCVYFVQKIVCFWFYDGNGVLDAHREVSYDLNNVKKCLAQLNVQAEKRTTIMLGHTEKKIRRTVFLLKFGLARSAGKMEIK